MLVVTNTRLYRKLLLPNGVALLLLLTLVALAYSSDKVALLRDGLNVVLLLWLFVLLILSALALSLGQLVEAVLDCWRFHRWPASRTWPTWRRMRDYYHRLLAGSLGALLLWGGLVGWLVGSMLLQAA